MSTPRPLQWRRRLTQHGMCEACRAIYVKRCVRQITERGLGLENRLEVLEAVRRDPKLVALTPRGFCLSYDRGRSAFVGVGSLYKEGGYLMTVHDLEPRWSARTKEPVMEFWP
jgi:hypothetical protein